MKKFKSYKGQTLPILIVFLAVFLIISSAVFSQLASFTRTGSRAISHDQAVHVAEAGIDGALYQLNLNPPSSSSFPGETKTVATTGVFTTSVVDNGSGGKTITSTGYIPDADNHKAKQTITVDVQQSAPSVTYSFPQYDVLAGGSEGGISMDQSAKINKPAFSNGDISGGNQNYIDTAYAVGIIYPIIQTPNGKFPNQSPQPLPDLSADYQKWRDWAVAGGSTPCPCNITSNTQAGPQRYDGDLTISSNVNFTVKGPIHVIGNLTLNGGGISLDNSFGTSGTVVIVDGNIELKGNSYVESTLNGGEILFISTLDSGGSIPIIISNNQSNRVGSIFYNLRMIIWLTNKGQAAALYGDRIVMWNNSLAGYSNHTSNFITGSTTGNNPWTLKKGTYHIK